MIVELGHFALILALMVALVQATLPLWGAQRGDARLMALAGPAAGVQLVLIGISFAALTWAFVASDFSLAVVVYELLTGRRPFDGDTDFATLYRITHEAPTPPRFPQPMSVIANVGNMTTRPNNRIMAVSYPAASQIV